MIENEILKKKKILPKKRRGAMTCLNVYLRFYPENLTFLDFTKGGNQFLARNVFLKSFSFYHSFEKSKILFHWIPPILYKKVVHCFNLNLNHN